MARAKGVVRFKTGFPPHIRDYIKQSLGDNWHLELRILDGDDGDGDDGDPGDNVFRVARGAGGARGSKKPKPRKRRARARTPTAARRLDGYRQALGRTLCAVSARDASLSRPPGAATPSVRRAKQGQSVTIPPESVTPDQQRQSGERLPSVGRNRSPQSSPPKP